jgi:hypothetical protein
VSVARSKTVLSPVVSLSLRVDKPPLKLNLRDQATACDTSQTEIAIVCFLASFPVLSLGRLKTGLRTTHKRAFQARRTQSHLMKIVRLASHETRSYRQNTPKLVDPKGNVVRDATREEVLEAEQCRAKGKKHTVTVTLPAHLVDTKGEFVRVATAKEVATGNKQIAVKEKGETKARYLKMVTKKSITCSVMSGRQMLEKHYFEKFGECQLRSHTGQVLRTVRDPNRVLPASADGSGNYMKPESCECKGWGNAHPGKHHYVCQYNQNAPAEERSDAPEDGVDRGEPNPLMDASTSVSESSGVENAAPSSGFATAQTSSGIFSPEECPHGCTSWTMPDGSKVPAGQHHPVCAHFEPWEAQKRGGRCFLISLEDGHQVRVATAEEVQEAEKNLASDGAATVKVGDVTFAVQGEDFELLPAAAKQRKTSKKAAKQ